MKRDETVRRAMRSIAGDLTATKGGLRGGGMAASDWDSVRADVAWAPEFRATVQT